MHITEAQPRRRRRPALSCIACRSRKIRCDRQQPCKNCMNNKIECKYRAALGVCDPQKSHQRSSFEGSISYSLNQEPANSSKERERRTKESPFRQCDRSLVQDPISSSRSNENSSDAPEDGVARLLDGTNTHEADREAPLPEEQASTNFIRSSGILTGVDSSLLGLRSVFEDKQISVNKSRVLKWIHWMGSAQEFATVISCFADYSREEKETSSEDGELAAITACIRDLLAKCKSIASTSKINRPSRCLQFPKFRLSSPARETMDTVVDMYFDYFESFYRILHQPSFRKEYERCLDDPARAPFNIKLKVHLVASIGLALRKQVGPDLESRNLFLQWVYAAQTWLSGPLEKNRLDISELQIYCLTILARQVLSVGGELTWMSMGSLMHRGMQIGLHRDPKHFAGMSFLQAEVRRRLWATILEMTVQSSLDAGMPPRFCFDEFDTQPPANLNDDELDDMTTAFQPHSDITYTTTSIQLLLFKSLPIRFQAVKLLNGLRATLSYLEVLDVSSQIQAACRRCSEFCSSHKPFGLSLFHTNMLEFLLRRFLLPLHCPFASQAHANTLFSGSLKIGMDTSLALMSMEKDECYSNLLLSGGGFLKEGLRSVSTAISLELLHQVELQHRDGTLKHLTPYREMLKQSVRDMIALSLERVRCGETNVKGHMFLCMILAQVKGMEEGTSVKLEIAKSAKDSLEICHDILQTNLYIAQAPSMVVDTVSEFYFGEETYASDIDMDFFFSDVNFAS